MGLTKIPEGYKRKFFIALDYSLEGLNKKVLENVEKYSGTLVEAQREVKTTDGRTSFVQFMVIIVRMSDEEIEAKKLDQN